MSLRLFAALAGVAVAAVVAGVLVLGGGEKPAGNPSAAVAEHPGAIPAAVRTVAVSRTMPMPSAHERRLSAMLEQGTMPGRPMIAAVLTDSDCTPDAQMISRCENVVQLASGRRLVLRHPHDMRSVPCLAPGERVLLVPADA